MTSNEAQPEGFDHGVYPPSCIDCHMPRTATEGAGSPGFYNQDEQYLHGDIASHLFVVPRKDAIAGVPVTEAMPIPYTNACSLCHQNFPPANP